MPRRNARIIKSLTIKAAELAVAVPQVIAHRVTRMAIAGPRPSARDRREFDLMGAEKTAAFTDSWNAMATQAVRANQALAKSWFRSLWSLSTTSRPSASALAAQFRNVTLDVLGKGMAPVHRKAVANAKRLARTKLR